MLPGSKGPLTVLAPVTVAGLTMANGSEIAPPSPLLAAASVYPEPILSIARSLKVAVPLTAATVAVPCRVPADGLLPKEIVTLPVEVVGLPAASTISTFTAGVMGELAFVFEG